MDIKYGDVLFADLGEAPKGIQGGKRPVVVIQNDIGNHFSPTILIVPLTKQLKKENLPTHQILYKNQNNGLKVDSTVLGEQIRIISKDVIKYKMGKLNQNEWGKVEEAFKASFPKQARA